MKINKVHIWKEEQQKNLCGSQSRDAWGFHFAEVFWKSITCKRCKQIYKKIF